MGVLEEVPAPSSRRSAAGAAERGGFPQRPPRSTAGAARRGGPAHAGASAGPLKLRIRFSALCGPGGQLSLIHI
eukprot:3921548-Alexandrium_andersonii.AAC.1